MITSGIPLEGFVVWLRAFKARVVLEFVGPKDDMVRLPLRGREKGQFAFYTEANFLRIVEKYFLIVDEAYQKARDRRIFALDPR